MFPFAMIVLDGFGAREEKRGNAPALASMPTWHYLQNMYPHTLLHASGTAVGLLANTIGNSEVGHFTLGAGRIVPSLLQQFNNLIENNTFKDLPGLQECFSLLRSTQGRLHIMGLLSDGGVHSHINHLYALLGAAAHDHEPSAFLHLFTDGRDVKPYSAATFLTELEAVIHRLNYGSIASLQGRYYAMDRDMNWDRTEKAFKILTSPSLPYRYGWQSYLQEQYAQHISDEFIKPVSFIANSHIRAGDGLIFFNVRPDRARQITQAFLDRQNTPLKEKITPKSLQFFLSFTNYFEQQPFKNNRWLLDPAVATPTLLSTLYDQGKGKIKITTLAETEKQAHITTFLHGKTISTLPGEVQHLIASIKAKNYIDHPKMSAHRITQQLLSDLRNEQGDFFVANYANADMVGHSGNLEATIKACECLDEQLTLLYHEIVERRNGTLCITADHGNAEQMIHESDGSPNPAHTTNKVPFLIAHQSLRGRIITPSERWGLADVAPTILTLLHFNIPDAMNQDSML